jgi:hypothetical protein
MWVTFLVVAAVSACLAMAAPALISRRDSSLKLAAGRNIERVIEAPEIQFPTAIVAAPDGTVYLGQDPMDMPGPPTSPIDSVVAIKNGQVRAFAEGLWARHGARRWLT